MNIIRKLEIYPHMRRTEYIPHAFAPISIQLKFHFRKIHKTPQPVDFRATFITNSAARGLTVNKQRESKTKVGLN